MEGVLEQILYELKEINQRLAKTHGLHSETSNDEMKNDTMKTKEAAKYLEIAEYRLRALTKQGKIRHIKAGNRYLYKRKSLDSWLEETQEASIQKREGEIEYGKIRKIKE